MVMDNLPRFFRSGDEVTLSPVVFNRTGKESDFTVSLKSEMLDISSTSQVIHLKDGESRAVPFAVVPKSSGPSSSAGGVKIDMEAKSNTTGEVDSLEYTLPLENSVLYETVSTIGHTDSTSFDEKIDLS